MIKNDKLVLIVEDDLLLRNALAEKFEIEGFKIMMAKNGQEGLEEALTSHPDIILLDIVMPVMDGATMLKNLRNDDWGSGVPVIVLTNLSDPEKVSELVDLGVIDYLIKSDWKIDDLIKIVKKFLNNY